MHYKLFTKILSELNINLLQNMDYIFILSTSVRLFINEHNNLIQNEIN